ncbi:MAG: hypothetical protein ABSG77_17005 [Candidatus Acidiferrum sp.]|jgi:hypothetical protein
MFAAMIFTIAIVALFQFALYYWRAVLTGVASQAVSNRVLEAAQVAESGPCGADFEKLAILHELTPELKSDHSGLGLVRAYYEAIHGLQSLFGQLSPAVANWGEREMALCARYAAVQIERRLQDNLAQAASIRSC